MRPPSPDRRGGALGQVGAGQGRREAAASDAHAAFTVRLERAPPPAGSLTIEMAISAEHAPVCRQRSELGNDVILSSLRP